MSQISSPHDEWVMLSYRLPREPSTPRISLWRRLKKVCVAQVADGLVALPADARTREQLEWAADYVVEHDGEASVWLARPASAASARALATAMRSARAEEYLELAAAARDALTQERGERRRALERLRRTRRQIGRRDYFPPVERDAAGESLRALEDSCALGADVTDRSPEVAR